MDAYDSLRQATLKALIKQVGLLNECEKTDLEMISGQTRTIEALIKVFEVLT